MLQSSALEDLFAVAARVLFLMCLYLAEKLARVAIDDGAGGVAIKRDLYVRGP